MRRHQFEITVKRAGDYEVTLHVGLHRRADLQWLIIIALVRLVEAHGYAGYGIVAVIQHISADCRFSRISSQQRGGGESGSGTGISGKAGRDDVAGRFGVCA